MQKKYELLEREDNGLCRIKAVRSFGEVCVGSIGGYIASEKNLAHYGNAWVSGDAKVFGNAHVYGNAWVSGDAWVSGNAWVYGDANVSGDAHVYGDAKVFGDAKVSGNAKVYGDAWVSGNAWVSGDAKVFGNAHVSSNAKVTYSPICLTGLEFHITAYAGFVQIGCKIHTIKEWRCIFKTGTYRDLSGGDYEKYRAAFELCAKLVEE